MGDNYNNMGKGAAEVKNLAKPSRGKDLLLSALAHFAVFLIYAGTLLIAVAVPLLRKALRLKKMRRTPGQIQVLVTGTFYNEGWIKAHLIPLVTSQAVAKVWLVCDGPWFPLEGVSYVVPPPLMRQIFGRSLSRILMVFATALRYKPDLLMGYHIMPNSLACLAAASLVGSRSAYQMTGGPIQLIGGGPGSENSLLRLLGRHSAFLERLVFTTVRRFDLVIVRGQGALDFAKTHNLGTEKIIITAGIDTEVFRPGMHLPVYDIIFVSRLIKGKGLEYFIEVLHYCRQKGMNLKTGIVGDGPMMTLLSEMLENFHLENEVDLLGRRDDVHSLLAESKIFVLTSMTEGMSIALLEALASGLPAAVTRVGDLGDAVKEGVTGVFLDGKDPSAAAKTLCQLLEDHALLRKISVQARQIAEERYSIKAIAQYWDTYFRMK